MKKLFLYCLAILGIMSCNNELGTEYPMGKVKSFHLIDHYRRWDGVKLEAFRNNNTNGMGIMIYFETENLNFEIASKELTEAWNASPKQTYKLSSEGFDELAEGYNDEGYEWEFKVRYRLDKETMDAALCHYALERGLKKIEIKSDADFDKEHPAGKSLNDIVKFNGISYSQFLTSNVNKKRVNIQDLLLGQINKKCSELSEFDLNVLGGDFALDFIKNPTITKTHNITVRITDVDGVVYSDTVEVKF